MTISFDERRPGKWAVAVLVLLLVAGLAWWLAARQAGGGPNAADGAASQALFPWSRAGSGMMGPSAASGVPSSALYAPVRERPEFVTPDEWVALQEAVRDNPDHEQQLARLVAFLSFQKKFEQVQTLRQPGEQAQRQALARELLDALPPMVNRHELSGEQAKQIQASLLEALEPNIGRRQALIEQEARRLPPVPIGANGQPEPPSVHFPY